MLKKFLFSSVLTATVAVSAIATAEDTTHKAVHKKSHHHHHHAKGKRHDDAFNPSAHKKHGASEEVVLFANSQKQSVFVEAPKDKLVNNDGLSVKVGGKVDVQYGVIDQKSGFKNPSNNENLPQAEDVRPSSMPTFGGNGSRYANQHAS